MVDLGIVIELLNRPEPEARGGEDHPVECQWFQIPADQSDICEVLRRCERSKMLLKRGNGALGPANLVVFHPGHLKCYWGMGLRICT